MTLRQMQGRDDLPAIDWSRPPRRIREFDHQITAPLAGYVSAEEYDTRTSPGPRLTEIRLPTTILAAADDPVVPIGPLELRDTAMPWRCSSRGTAGTSASSAGAAPIRTGGGWIGAWWNG